MNQPTETSSCITHFGFDDFDLDRLKGQRLITCPIRSCSTPLVEIKYGQKHLLPFCPTHGIRFHSNTFVYWNGLDKFKESQKRNFPICPDLANEIALNSVNKAESHRLGYEMSEDALSWNVFVGLAVAGKLRDAVLFLTGNEIEVEPDLYLWGELIDVKNGRRDRFKNLDEIRNRLESDIHHFQTEPDIMLVVDGKLVICIEAKFGSGNPLAYEGTEDRGDKPTAKAKLLERYLDNSGDRTRSFIDSNGIGETFHSQLFRNIIFASEMAAGQDWHVVNLVSKTQWDQNQGGESKRYSFKSPEEHIRSYLRPNNFSFHTWEEVYKALIQKEPKLQSLSNYMKSKSAHYHRAFNLM